MCSIFANNPSTVPDSLFAERIQSIDFFSRQSLGLDLYGIGWEVSTYSFVHGAYRGKCANKKQVQQQYKFCIAFENVEKIPGLITEKIFDCFAAGTVPIYLGAPNITDYIPSSCFVDFRQFANYNALYDYLANMSEGEYQKYLDAAKAFIGSPQYRLFTSTHYAEVVMEQVKLLTTRKTSARSLIGMKWQLLKLIVNRPQVLKNWRPYRRFVMAMVTIW